MHDLTMAFKRKRVFAPRRNVRRRRFGMKRRSGGRRRNTMSLTTQKGSGSALGFRSRRIRPRTFRRMIYRDTLFKTHYRSVFANTFVVSTPAATQTSTVSTFSMLQPTAGSLFWTLAGGARGVDTGVAVPDFAGDVILRGGKCGITIANASDDNIKYTMYYFWTNDDPDLGLIPVTESIAWDPSVTADFSTRVGKIIWQQTVQLEPGQSYSFERRLKCQKIDQARFAVQGRVPHLVIKMSNVSNNDISASRINLFYNLSFSSDVL